MQGDVFNPLNAVLNPICHLLALLGVHHILHVSRIRVKKCAREIFGQPHTYRQHNDNAFENNRSKVILFKCFYIYRKTVLS